MKVGDRCTYKWLGAAYMGNRHSCGCWHQRDGVVVKICQTSIPRIFMVTVLGDGNKTPYKTTSDYVIIREPI